MTIRRSARTGSHRPGEVTGEATRRLMAAAMACFLLLLSQGAFATVATARHEPTVVPATPVGGTPAATADGDGETTISYTPDSSIMGETRITAPAVFAAIHNVLPVEERYEVWSYLKTLSVLCETLGLDFVVMAAQWDLETDTGRSLWWRERKNPAGIGVTGDPAQNEASQTWPDGAAAVYGHVAHMVAYVWGKEWKTVWPDNWPGPLEADQRFNAPINAGYHADRLIDLNNTWAVDPQANYHGKLASRANRIAGDARLGAGPVLSIP
ncbi:hypothetical protein BH20CHL4_BH20CHL4_16080 [soil metagenome]